MSTPRETDARLGVYLDRLAARPPLDADEERRLVAAAQQGDPGARARLIDAFMPLIGSAARPYRVAQGIERLELLQEGVVGLLRALERYDPGRGIPFWGYAAWWVRQAMQQLVSELTRPVVLSDRALRQLARLKEAHRDALNETGQEPDRDELSGRSGLTRDQVDDLLATEGRPRSLDQPIPGHDGAVGTFGDLIEDPLAEGEYERVLDELQQGELLSLLATLSDREREVIEARYGLDRLPERSLRELGDSLGISAERVRQIEARALGKLAAAAGVT